MGRLPTNSKVMVSNPGHAIPKALKMVLAAECVRLPEWAELPEWTTGMDFYMQSSASNVFYILRIAYSGPRK